MQNVSRNLKSFPAPLLLFIICLAAHADVLSHSFMLDDSFFRDDTETLKL
jgi:hypothetical protein